ncbi:hypothetical protein AGLY_004564 [Aphis glycines]|uniref:ATP-dependent DNA helicase n=1 Tax=Aphis glycines TaxID=307491 RepID=A0A6G0TYF1_APHGL|nr:hypothetical protein AGLY_004564 [Aphis glycines]
MAAVDDNRNVQKVFYVDGPGGTGKTTLYGCLIWSLRNRRRSVLCVAFTGIAASLMDSGMTVHSTVFIFYNNLSDTTSFYCLYVARYICDVVDLIDFVYPQHMSLANVDDFARKIVLCPRNEECRQINRTVLQRIKGAERTYTAIDTVVIDNPDEEANYPTEFLNLLELNGLPPFKLTLRVGAIVMLLRNLDPKSKLCNGTRLVVTELRRHNFRVRVLSGDGSAQDDVIIPAIPMTTGGEDDLPFKMKRIQFPVRLSFAMIINKSQGQTFDRVGLLLLSPVFTHGNIRSNDSCWILLYQSKIRHAFKFTHEWIKFDKTVD